MTDAVVHSPPAAISLTDVVKRFGAVAALDGASFTVRPGTIHALLGENGAGKTTLMRIAFGMLRPDAGQLVVQGQRTPWWRSTADAIRAGIGMVHQHFTLVPAMTTAENVELGAATLASWRFDRRDAERHVRELGRAAGLVVDPTARVADLSVAAQQRVEILKALRREAAVLILDEPTAVLAPAETEHLLRWLRAFVERGGTVILITHKLREALAVADDVTVLRGGRTVLAAARAELGDNDVQTLTRVIIGDDPSAGGGGAADLVVGTGAGTRASHDARLTDSSGSSSALSSSAPSSSAPSSSEPVAMLEEVVAVDAKRRETVRATVAIYPGEVVGIAGIEGAGHHTLLRVLAGRTHPVSGRVRRPTEVGFIPEDRHREAIILDFSLTENVALRGAGGRRGRIPWRVMHQQTAALLREFDVRATGATIQARTLSGGNQQRLVLARELTGRPALVIAENPTRGLDVRATAEVHNRLRVARDSGAAIVLYSSDLDEVLALSTRVLAVHAGSIREVAPAKDLVGRVILGLV